MDAAACTVSFDPAVDGGRREIQTPRLFEQCLVQRLALPAVVIAEMNPHHFGGAAERHDCASVDSGVSSRCVYLMTSASESTTRPSSTSCSSTGRYARIFTSSSTTDSKIGRNRPCAPYPAIPR